MASADAPSNSKRRRSIGRDFRLVWLSVIVSSTGDGMFITAFPLLALTLTRDPVLIAGVTVASRLPWLLFSMLTGTVADRMDRRRLMIGADVVRFFIVGALGVVIVANMVNIWFLYLCAFLLSTGETFHVNAAQAILPALVESEDLLQANARFGGAQIASTQFIGPPLGAMLFNAATSLPFFADAVSFAGSAMMVSGLPDVHHVEPPTTRLRDDVLEGLQFVRDNAALRRITGLLALINFFYFAAISLLVLYTTQQLHSGKITYTALFIGAAVGTVLTRFLVTPMSRRFGVKRTLTLAVWLWAISMSGLALTPYPLVAVAMFVILGAGTGLWLALNTTVRQQITPARLRGRMNAAYRTVSWGVVPFGAAFGGLSAHWFGLRTPFLIAGGVMLTTAAFAPKILQPIADAATV